ncbi:hypothetical protein PSMK_00620 [Phycisphaera mikurensis NBRC 102666]|uniref:Uncharacterized protein n=1 Tax=Phycisphaera mikurensis (strain NBRC 102666 / KCTC 22515 / FYK2301M01) TaxID=1142394 RepID=I0IAD3_PHYMF|nr:hypothetical protein PSMK_00620 [Phycisphaera mikurensis NBRC 102666]
MDRAAGRDLPQAPDARRRPRDGGGQEGQHGSAVRDGSHCGGVIRARLEASMALHRSRRRDRVAAEPREGRSGRCQRSPTACARR